MYPSTRSKNLIFRQGVIFVTSLLFLFLLTSFSSTAQSPSNENPNNSTKDFYDVPKDHWSYKDVKWMASKGIITGFPDNSFRPN